MNGRIILLIILILYLTWNVHAAVNCNESGPGRFPVPSDNTCKKYTFCVFNGSTYLAYNYVCPGISLFSPYSAKCTTNYTCKVTPEAECTAEGFFSNPSSTDCSSYIMCIASGGSYIKATYTCPINSYFNPKTTGCETNYDCSTSTFTCPSSGRFANSSNTACKSYYLCVTQADGTFVHYVYTCPSTSVFNPYTKLCSTSYTCPT